MLEFSYVQNQKSCFSAQLQLAMKEESKVSAKVLSYSILLSTYFLFLSNQEGGIFKLLINSKEVDLSISTVISGVFSHYINSHAKDLE